MRYASITTAALFFALGTGLAQAGTLTNELARRALLQWLAKDGTAVVVEDVQEIPAANMAKADVTVTNFIWNRSNIWHQPVERQVYSGHLDVLFVHYTDGSWALTQAKGPMGSFENLHFVVR